MTFVKFLELLKTAAPGQWRLIDGRLRCGDNCSAVTCGCPLTVVAWPDMKPYTPAYHWRGAADKLKISDGLARRIVRAADDTVYWPPQKPRMKADRAKLLAAVGLV